MALPIRLPFLPMEALSVPTIPEGDDWQYEPKWDGFRCIVFRDGKTVRMQSKAGQPLERYFPELAAQFLEVRYLSDSARVKLSPATTRLSVVRRWFASAGSGLDGIIAKELSSPYRSGERAGMVKVKQLRTVDCVVGGFRYATRGRLVGSLLLGLYDDAGLLHHVGFCSGLTTDQKKELTPRLVKLIKKPGFTGQAPGGPSRWSTERSAQWEPLAPKLVIEVQYDHFTGGRFRHGTRFLRWRPDKAPRQCTTEQLESDSASPLRLL